eukprot:3398171-Amphidinium_carterae.1
MSVNLAHRAGLNADMLCAALLALHDAIYNKGIDLAEIEQHSEAGYEELLLSMASVHFQGGAGKTKNYRIARRACQIIA